MNLYEIYLKNGRRTGFWVRSNAVPGDCAKVFDLRFRGRSTIEPEWNAHLANLMVWADVYDTESGRLKSAGGLLSFPGSDRWIWSQPPSWSIDPPSRPLDGRVRLWVRYDDRADAKKIGAKWSTIMGSYWLPAGDAEALSRAGVLGFLDEQVFFRPGRDQFVEALKVGGVWNKRLKLLSFSARRPELLEAARQAGFELVTMTPAELEAALAPEDFEAPPQLDLVSWPNNLSVLDAEDTGGKSIMLRQVGEDRACAESTPSL